MEEKEREQGDGAIMIGFIYVYMNHELEAAEAAVLCRHRGVRPFYILTVFVWQRKCSF